MLYAAIGSSIGINDGAGHPNGGSNSGSSNYSSGRSGSNSSGSDISNNSVVSNIISSSDTNGFGISCSGNSHTNELFNIFGILGIKKQHFFEEG